MTAVIWTDVVQMFLYVAGAMLSFFVILHQIPGGWTHVQQVAGAAHKFQMFDFRFAWTAEFFSRSYSFWAGLIGGCFLTTASHGTEQLLVQRLLAAKTESQSRAALFSSWVVIFFQFALFLCIGTLLFVQYSELHLGAPKPPEALYPGFVWNNLPAPLAGLVIAAILAAGMSNLSAALNALASTTVMDFYRARAKSVTDAAALRIARLATIAWGGVLLAIAIAARHSKSVLEAGLTIGSIPMGALLGVFLLGVLTRKPREGAAIAGVASGLTIVVGIHFYTPIAWTWYVLIGTLTTFGSVFQLALPGSGAAPLETAGVREPLGGLPHLSSPPYRARGITRLWKIPLEPNSSAPLDPGPPHPSWSEPSSAVASFWCPAP